jgi:hypothetical protein
MKTMYQAMFFTRFEGKRIHTDSEYFVDKPTEDELGLIAKNMNNDIYRVMVFRDKYFDESYTHHLFTLKITNP